LLVACPVPRVSSRGRWHDLLSRLLIPTLNNADSWDSQKPTNLNRWGKPEVCDGFGDLCVAAIKVRMRVNQDENLSALLERREGVARPEFQQG
jgi:hypothetical protein